MINLKNMYKNSKHGILMKAFLFVAFLFLSLGLYFCFAPKNEVSGAGNNSFTINLQGSGFNLNQLVESGKLTVDGSNGITYGISNYGTVIIPLNHSGNPHEDYHWGFSATVTLTACSGATITGVTNSSNGSWNSNDKTYSFRITCNSDTNPSRQITCNVSGTRNFAVNLKNSNPDFDLNQLVENGTATCENNNYTMSNGKIIVPMNNSTAKSINVTLTACYGIRIRGADKENNDDFFDTAISNTPGSFDGGKTYTFTILNCTPDGSITCDVLVDILPKRKITLKGLEETISSGTAPKIGEFVQQATAKDENNNIIKTVDNVSDDAGEIVLEDVAFSSTDVLVHVTLTPKAGYLIHQVYKDADTLIEDTDSSDLTYTFSVNCPSEAAVTYTVSRKLQGYHLQFKDSVNDPRFTVSTSLDTPGNSQSVVISYNTSTTVNIHLNEQFTKSYENINLTPHGKFAERNNDNKIKLIPKNNSSNSFYVNFEEFDFSNYDWVALDGPSGPNSKDNISVIYKIDNIGDPIGNNDTNDYIVKMKSGNFRIFKHGETPWLPTTLVVFSCGYEITDYDVDYKLRNIEYTKISTEHGKVTYEFKLLNPDIQITDNDYFTVEGIEPNIYNVKIKCDAALSNIAGDLKLTYNDPTTSQLTEVGFSGDELCATVPVRGTDESSTITLKTDQDSGFARNYVNWFSEKSDLNTVISIPSYGFIQDSDSAKIAKRGNTITLGRVISSNGEILLKPPPNQKTQLRFKIDENLSSDFNKLIGIYPATILNEQSVSTDDSHKLPLCDKNGDKYDWGTSIGAEVSVIEDKTFYYIVAAERNDGINLEDIKKMLYIKTSEDSDDVFGVNFSISPELNSTDAFSYESQGLPSASSDFDKHFIVVSVTLNYTKNKDNLANGFDITLDGLHYPTRKATFISSKNMAIVTGKNGLPQTGKDKSTSEQTITEFSFDYNSDLEFSIIPRDQYEIYNFDPDVTISINGTPISENEFSHEIITEGEKEGYNINLSQVRYDIEVNINFDPLHKVISLSNIEGLSYYEVTKGENEDSYKVNENNKIHGKYTVNVGDPFYFAIKPEQGYDLDNSEILLDGKKLKPEEIEGYEGYRIYKIENIQNDHTISGSISKLRYTVTFQGYSDDSDAVKYKRDDALILGNRLDVEYGDNIFFTVDIGEKYNKSKFKIKDGNVEINLVDGKYSVVNITTDKTITVENISVNSYNINFVKNDAVKFLDESNSEVSGIKSVTYEDKLSFKVEAKDGYTITDQMKVISVSESGVRKEIKPDRNGDYSINGIKEDYEISIENVESVMFKVTLAPTDGVTYLNDGGAVISGVSKVKYGNNFEFSVNVDDAYDDSIAGMYIIVNGGNLSAQKLATGRYIISNITEDILIKVGNIRKNSYIVNLVKVDGMDYYDSSKKVISGDNSVNHGDSFSFKVGLYPAYNNSSVKVMLGNEELTANDSGFYTVPKVIENKTVTIVGVEENEESKVVNTINNLPSSVSDLTDVDAVIAATKDYEKLSDEQKQKVSNIDVLRRLQEQVKEFHHVSNDVRISGVDWNIKLVAVPISFDKEACTRIYKKLNSEYIVSLYDVYLWDVINDVKYNLPEGQEATITLPKPDLTYFEKPTGIHEKDGGKISYLTLSIGSDIVRFTTDSFSPMGIIANRSLAPGRSSLLDAADANIGLIRDYALSTFGSGGVNNKGDSYSDINLTDANDSTNLDGTTGNINEKFKSRNNPVTAQGSAIRLALVLMLLILLAIVIIIIIEGIKRRKKEKNN